MILPRSIVWWEGWKSMLVTADPWCMVQATVLGKSSRDQLVCWRSVGYVTWGEKDAPTLMSYLKERNSTTTIHIIVIQGKKKIATLQDYLFNGLSWPQTFHQLFMISALVINHAQSGWWCYWTFQNWHCWKQWVNYLNCVLTKKHIWAKADNSKGSNMEGLKVVQSSKYQLWSRLLQQSEYATVYKHSI